LVARGDVRDGVLPWKIGLGEIGPAIYIEGNMLRLDNEKRRDHHR
jgi:hypothetical protein